MSATTSRYGIQYPTGDDPISGVATDLQNLAMTVDNALSDVDDRHPDNASMPVVVNTVDELNKRTGATGQIGIVTNGKFGMSVYTNDGNKWVSKVDTSHGYKNAVVIGDSLSRGYYQNVDHPGHGMGDYLCKFLGITNYQNVAHDGSGYQTTIDPTFAQEWAGVSNKADVDVVFIIGGVNDVDKTVYAQAQSLYRQIMKDAPNAELHIFPVACGWKTPMEHHYGTLQSIKRAVNDLNADNATRFIHVYEGVHRWGMEAADWGKYADGNVHMLDGGYQRWGGIAARLVRTGQHSYWPSLTDNIQWNPYGSTPVLQNVRQCQIIEQEGTITFHLVAQAGQFLAKGYKLFNENTLCYSENPTKFAHIPHTNAALEFDPDGIHIANGDVPAGEWIFVNFTTPAGF